MRPGKLIPSGFQGKLAKIVIQGPQDKRSFTCYGIALYENSQNLYIKMGDNEVFFRKEHIDFIGFPHDNKPKSNPVTTETDRNETAKVIYKTTDEQTKVAFGKLSVSESYYYIKLLDGSEIVVPKDKIVKISYSKQDVPDKKDWTDHKAPRRKRKNTFSYSQLWKNHHVKECEK